MAEQVVVLAPLQEAIDADAYSFLEQNAPGYLVAIDKVLAQGVTPAQVRWFVSAGVGADRQGLALRCEQAARHIQRRMAG